MQRLDFLKLAVPKLDDRATPTAPKNTEQWCWHCCHPFPTAKVVLPVSYDDRRDIWKFAGAFCSWSCAKGYSRDHRSTWNNACGQLLTLMHKPMVHTLLTCSRTMLQPQQSHSQLVVHQQLVLLNG